MINTITSIPATISKEKLKTFDKSYSNIEKDNSVSKTNNVNQIKSIKDLSSNSNFKSANFDTNSFDFSDKSKKITINDKSIKMETINVKATSFINQLERQFANTSGSNYVQENLNKYTSELKDVLNGIKSERSEEIPTDFIYSLSDVLSQLEKSTSFSKDNLNQINSILDKITTQEKLTGNELVKLKDFSSYIVQNAQTIGIDPKEFEKLGSLIDGVSKAREVVNQKRDEFNVKVDALEQKMEQFLSICKDPSMKVDSNFVAMVQAVTDKYKGIKSSGNEVSVAMFSTYMDKLFSTMEDIKSGKETNPLAFANLQREYQTSVNQALIEMSKGQKPTSIQSNGFWGKMAKDVYVMIERQAKAKAEQGGTTLSDTYKEMARDIKTQISFTPTESKTISQVRADSVKKVMNDERMYTMVSDIRESTTDVAISFKELNQSQSFLEEIEIELRKYINSDEFTTSFESLLESDSLDNVLDSIIQDIIKTADYLESSINFDFILSDSISTLFEKFRTIVTDLEEQTKKLNQDSFEKKRIEEKHSKEIRDNKEYQNRLDKDREELKRNFLSSLKNN